MSHRPSNKERNRWTVDLVAPGAERLSQEMRQLGFSDIRVEQLDLHPMPAMSVLGGRGE